MPSTLAFNLLVAFQAHRLGVTMAYIERKYKAQQPGPYWFALAERVEGECNQILGSMLASEAPARIIQ